MKSDFATGRKPGADEWERENKPGFVRGLQDFGVATKSRFHSPRSLSQNSATRNFRLASLSTKAGFFASSCMQSLSGFADKNVQGWIGRKPQGVVPIWGQHNVLAACSSGAQKAVQASSEDFGGSSHRVKRWEFRNRHIVLRMNPLPRGKTMERWKVDYQRVANDRPTDGQV